MSKDFTILKISCGEIVNKTTIKKFFEGLNDGQYLLERSKHNKRSNPQNNFYWGLVIPMIQQGIKHLGTDLTKEECHEFLKARFNSEELVNEETGEMIQIPRSTKSMSKSNFSEYIGKIQQFASEFLNVVIPDPGTQVAIEYE